MRRTPLEFPPRPPARRAVRWPRGLLLAALLLGVVLVARPADAHQFGLSLIEVQVGDEDVRVTMTCDLVHLDSAARVDANDDRRITEAELLARRAEVGAYLVDRFHVLVGDRRCTGTPLDLVYDGPRTAGIATLRFACGEPLGTLELISHVFTEQQGNHQFIGVIAEDDQRFRVRFTRSQRRVVYEATPPAASAVVAQRDEGLETVSGWTVVRDFLGLGLEHIALGFDHLLFVLTLLVVARRLRDVVVLVTSFTVAHSITLAGAAVGVLAVPSTVVEPLIAASILFVALENILREEARRAPERVTWLQAEPRWRAGVVFAFGLVHGFGFASVLANLGLPAEHLLPALLAFNLGVEAGQLVIVLGSWGLLRLAMRSTSYPRWVQAASVVIGVVACWWLVERTLL